MKDASKTGSLISNDINEVDGVNKDYAKSSTKIIKSESGPNSERSSNEAKHVAKDLVKLSKDLEQAKRENKELEDALAKEREESKEKVKELKKDVSKEKELKSKANAKYREMKQMKEELEEKLLQAETAATSLTKMDGEVEELRKELELSRSQVDDLLQKMSTSVSISMEKSDVIDTLKKENGSLSEQLRITETQLKGLSESVKGLDTMKLSLTERENKILELENKLKESEQLKLEISRLVTENTKLSGIIQAKDTKLTLLTEDFEKLKMKSSSVEEALKTNYVSLEEYEAKVNEANELVLEEIKYKQQISELENKINVMNEETEVAKELMYDLSSNQSKEFESKILELNTELEKYKGLEEEYKEEIDKLKYEISILEESLSKEKELNSGQHKEGTTLESLGIPEHLHSKISTDYPKMFVTVNEMLIYAKENGIYDEFVEFLRAKSEVFTKANWDSFDKYNGK